MASPNFLRRSGARRSHGKLARRRGCLGPIARGSRYAVLYPNVRGSVGYGEKFLEMNARLGGGDFKDVMSGVEDLVTKGIANPARLGIGGWSYGGYMAEWAVTQTDLFKAAVSGAGMANLISEFGTEKGSADDEWFFGTPMNTGAISEQFAFPVREKRKDAHSHLARRGRPVDPIGQSRSFTAG